MIQLKQKSDCSGCHACANACPKDCVSMCPDEEGFLYPAVDASKCIKCGLCRKVCHGVNKYESHNRPDAYACYNTNEHIRTLSSSGGMFTLFAEDILEQGGVVFGAAFDEHLVVKHICIKKKEDLHKLRGSKYVQSRIGDAYKQAKQYLQSGQPVFFTGTPCQIGGLLMYLGKEYDNLYTADIICHGAPSPKVWELYIKHMEALHGSHVSRETPPFFRAKTQGWLRFSMQMQFENKTEYCMPFMQDSYMNAFINDLTLRPSCYSCHFKSLHRNSDVTLADFWGVNQLLPDMFDNKGTSLIFVNSHKGRCLFDRVKAAATYKPVTLDMAVKRNPAAYESAPLPFKRKTFMKNVNSENFDTLRQACENKSFFERVCKKVTRFLKCF